MEDRAELYEEDFLLWSEQQADLVARLAAGEDVRAQIDWEHVIDEIESVGRSELWECEFLLARSLTNLMRLASMPGDKLADQWRRDAKKWLGRVHAELKPYMRRRIDVGEVYARQATIFRKVYGEGAVPWPECPFRLEDLLLQQGLVELLLQDG